MTALDATLPHTHAKVPLLIRAAVERVVWVLQYACKSKLSNMHSAVHSDGAW